MGAPAVYGLLLSGGITQAMGASQQGDAAVRAAKFNASLIRQEGSDQAERIRTNIRRQTSENITRVAKSGVRLSGSPLAAIAENEFQAARQVGFVEESTRRSVEMARAQGRFARQSSRLNVASSILNTGGQISGFALGNRSLS